MNAVARAFPAGPTLATWWQQLSSFQPRELWVASLNFHRVDALVRVEHPCHIDRLSLRILDVLARAETTDALERHTGLLRQFLHRALTSLHAEGLVRNLAIGQWQLTAAGRQTRDTGSYGRRVSERRTFHFRAGVDGPPAYLPLSRSVGESWQPAEEWKFNVATLDDCLQHSREWKERHGFPLDVCARAMPDAPVPPDWRHVTVVTPMRLTVALAVAKEVRGLACASEGWGLDAAEPVFALGSAGYDVFPELAAPPSADACAAAWREWCEAQNHPDAISVSHLDLQGHRLLVAPSTALDERLRSIADGAWLLIGMGDVRRAARVEIKKA